MWNLSPTGEYEKRVKKWPKKHQRELIAVHNNLDTFFGALLHGAKLEQIKFGFMHAEPRGVIALDQKGGGAGLKETRLYIFPDPVAEIVHVITLGDKGTQKADIQYASEFVDSLRQGKLEEQIKEESDKHGS
jgi:hypothetical protein